MPKSERFILLENNDAEATLATALETFNKLGWDVQFANENKLLGITPKSWSKKGQQIIATALNNELNIESEMVHGEALDIAGKNKKNVNTFLETYLDIEKNISQETLKNNIEKIIDLRLQSEEVIKKEQEEYAEIDKAMNLSNSNLYVTYAIIVINVLVFILMVINGAGLFEANSLTHLKWGSNYGPLTTSGDWWRLITSTFIHFGIIHIALNMYCLYMVGLYLEPMLGKVKYVVAYLFTGIIASLVSLWWHSGSPTNSAGASGAIFGMYGLFLALLTTKLIPQKVRNAQLKSIGLFVIYNLAFGMKGGVDNSAHIGGLISGFAIGYLFAMMIKAEKNEQKLKWVLPLIIIGTLSVSFAYLQKNQTSSLERNKILAELKQSDFKDNDKFNKKYNEVIEKQKLAIAVFADTTLTPDATKTKLTTFSLPLWNESEVIAKDLMLMDVSAEQQKKAATLLKYILLRKEEIQISVKVLNGEDGASEELIEIRTQMDKVIESLN